MNQSEVVHDRESNKATTVHRFSVGCFFLLTLSLLGCRDQPQQVAPISKQQTTTTAPEPEYRSATLPRHQERSVLFAVDELDSPWFEDISESSGLNFQYSDGSNGGCYQLLESVGGGVLATDTDSDGRLDVLLPGGGMLNGGDPIRVTGRSAGLFRNRSGLGVRFDDVTAQAGVTDASVFSHGGTIADVNSDGFEDAVVAGFHGLQVWLNQGDGTYTESAEQLGLISKKWNVSCAVADFDLDGHSDIYLLTYAKWSPDGNRRCVNDRQLRDICGPTMFPGESDALFRSNGALFEDKTSEMGIVAANRGLGIVAADIDKDSRPDFAVVNDVEENQLYLNRQDSAFQEDALVWGMAFSNTGEREGSMGVDVGDFDRNGLPDVWYTNYAQQDNSLLRNSNSSGFLPAASVTGMTGVSRPWVGFGTGFADFNCDGWEDLFVINGHVAYERKDSPYFQPAQLFRNNQGNDFTDVSTEGGGYFAVPRSGRGAAMIDVDNDGAVDLVVSHQNSPVAVLRNNHSCEFWTRIRLVGVKSDRFAVGASVTLSMKSDTRTTWRINGGSYLSHSDPRLLFLLDSNQEVDAKVTWPGGSVEVFPGIQAGQTNTLVQGRSKNVRS